MEIVARRYDTQQPVRVTIDGDHITAIEPCEAAGGELPFVAPALLDLQMNGFSGQDFTDPALTIGHVRDISLALDAHGLGGYCPTVTTQSHEVIAHALKTIADACEEDAEVARRVIGIHLEGPYISAEEGPRGAHPLEHCRPPDWDEFQRLQEAARGTIEILTLSPEYDGSADFIRRVAESGVTVAIGHTAADSDQIRAAVDAGARFSTHLGNGAHSMIRRHPNYIWDQLADDRLWASIIADGHHLPPAVIKSFLRAKTLERCLLVSDITGLAGMPPGEYRGTSLGDVDILDDGRIVVAATPQYLAGASLPIGVGIANLLNYAEVDLKTAIEMATLRPAELLELPDRPGLEVGACAELILFNLGEGDQPRAGVNSFELLDTFKSGQTVYRRQR